MCAVVQVNSVVDWMNGNSAVQTVYMSVQCPLALFSTWILWNKNGRVMLQIVCFALQVRMWLWLVLFLPALSVAQRSEPVFSAITKTVLPPDYDNNPTQLNYGVAVTDVDGDGDLEIFVAGWGVCRERWTYHHRENPLNPLSFPPTSLTLKLE